MKHILSLFLVFVMTTSVSYALKTPNSLNSIDSETYIHYFPKKNKNHILILKEKQDNYYKFPGNYIYRDSSQWTDTLEQKIRKDLSFFKVYSQEIKETVSSLALKTSVKLIENQNPKIVIIALGENDGLYSKKINDIRLYLSTIIQTAKKHHARIILVGSQLPDYMGTTYINAFADMYSKLAKKHEIAYVPENKFTYTYPLFIQQYENPMNTHAQAQMMSPEVKKVMQAVEQFINEEKRQGKKSAYFESFYRFPQLSGQ